MRHQFWRGFIAARNSVNLLNGHEDHLEFIQYKTIITNPTFLPAPISPIQKNWSRPIKIKLKTFSEAPKVPALLLIEMDS